MKPLNQANFAAVLTWETMDKLIERGGSGFWKTVFNRAKRVDYLLLVGNRRGDNPNAPYKHGEGFLLAKVTGVREEPKHEYRKVFLFQEYAEVSLKGCWSKLTGGANPITYYDNWKESYVFNAEQAFERIGLNFDELEWKRLPEKANDVKDEENEEIINAKQYNQSDSDEFLTIPEAKRRLAKTLGVDESCISITING